MLEKVKPPYPQVSAEWSSGSGLQMTGAAKQLEQFQRAARASSLRWTTTLGDVLKYTRRDDAAKKRRPSHG
jgi:hypothetical protein